MTLEAAPLSTIFSPVQEISYAAVRRCPILMENQNHHLYLLEVVALPRVLCQDVHHQLSVHLDNKP